MRNEAELMNRYPADAALFGKERDAGWAEVNSREIRASLDFAITALHLDAPWEELHRDPVKEALAQVLFVSTLSCFGPNMTQEMHIALIRKHHGALFDELSTKNTFTANHSSVPCRLEGDGLSAVHHIPIFPTIPGWRPTIGDISPIDIIQIGDEFQVHLNTPSGYIWNKRLAVLAASELSGEVVGVKGNEIVRARNIAMPCVSGFQVMDLRDTCSEDCVMCSVPRGRGVITEEYWIQVSKTFDGLIYDAAKRDHAFTQTLSGGSEDSPDGGFHTAHERALTEIEQKVPSGMGVQVELEMMLPPDKSTWEPIMEILNRYAQKPGWKIGLAINMEVLNDAWKQLFLRKVKGTLTLADHIEFARLLRAKTDGRIRMSTLVMFGMKPVAMNYGQYMLEDLQFIKTLLREGIYVDYAQLKLQLGRPIESYPPPDPVLYMIQFVALRQMLAKAKLPYSPGCVGACGACHHVAETNSLLGVAKKRGISLSKVFAPILETLGPDYQAAFTKVFTI